MKYLITGATGAIGSAVVRQLAAEGEEVRAFVRDEEKFKRLLPDVSVEVVHGDALNPDDVRRAMAGVDVVFHCVNFPITQFERNLKAAKVLIEAASAEKPHIVFPGNTWVFGRPARTPITPDTPLNPPSRIARIKALVDGMLMGSELPVTVVHLPDFYGPNVVNPLVRPLFENALAGKDITFPAPVDVPHEFIYIEDAARALIAVAGREAFFGKRYTVGGVEPITVRRFAESIYRTAGTKGRVRGMPPWLLRLAGFFNAEAWAASGIMHVFAWDTTMDETALRQDTGFAPQVGYEEGIRRTIAWFRKERLGRAS
jgi:nucleoside-diphosphate-sugar epimerase